MSDPGPREGEVPFPDVVPAGRLESAAPAPLAPLVDEEEFVAFYRGFVHTLVTFLMWQGASLNVAADIAQDTMLKAYQSWSAIDHPKAWARRVASRALVRHVSRVEEDLVDQVPESTSLLCSPDDLAAWEQRHDILRLLKHLPTRQRQVLAWTMEHYTPAEIAEELRITSAAVRASLMKGRRALVVLMSPETEER